MIGRQKAEQRKNYRLKLDAALDAINSRFTSDDFNHFMSVVFDVLNDERMALLSQQELYSVTRFLRTMCKFIESSDLNNLLNKYNWVDTHIFAAESIKLSSEDAHNRLEIITYQIKEWMCQLPENRKNESIFHLVTEFFQSDFFCNEFIKWIKQDVSKVKISISQVLESYYLWFPYILTIKR